MIPTVQNTRGIAKRSSNLGEVIPFSKWLQEKTIKIKAASSRNAELHTFDPTRGFQWSATSDIYKLLRPVNHSL